MRTLVGLLSVLTLAAAARATPTARELVRVLGGYERTPLADEVKRLGPGADRALMAVAGDARWPAIQRVRAILALRFVPSAAAQSFLRALVEARRPSTQGLEVLELAAGLSALAPYPAQTPVLMSFVAHASAGVRQAAAAALQAQGAREAEPVLSARLAVEPDDGVREALVRAVTALRAP